MAAMRVKPASPLTEKHIFENQSVKVGRENRKGIRPIPSAD